METISFPYVYSQEYTRLVAKAWDRLVASYPVETSDVRSVVLDPHAHEDDAEQALRAGLALIDGIGELQAPYRLRARIGIATGLVVVGDLIGSGSAQEQAIVGDTPNLAARLQALAEANAIVIAESTRRQIGAMFELHDLGHQALKGFAEPQRTWRVVAENRALGRFEALRSGATPLIGRDEELELLLRRCAQARAGSGRVVLISGEPGVGKSRLSEALVEQIAGEPHVRLRYFCSPHHQDSALYPVIAQMERAAGFAHKDSAREKLGKLQAVLAATAPPIEDVALIADLHLLPSADLAPPLDVTPQRKKEKTFEAWLRQVEGLCRQQPVLMVFEDIHWIDPSSRELLDRTIERIANWPVLLVGTFRPEFQPTWTERPHVTMLVLTRLDRHDTAAMVANIAGNVALPREIVQEITERTDGVPLFVEELTNAVLESGAQTALSSVPHPAVSVPATLHASLMARLDRLGPAASDVAQTGAAIGREFGHELLASVADLPEPQLREALDRLANSGLLFVRGTPPHASYIFKHALVQDAAYGTMLRSRRQQLHARIAANLEDRFPEVVLTQPALLAQHCEKAGQTERAVEYWLKAGQHALARSAMTEAETLLRRGLSLAADLPDGARQEHELELLIALASVLTAVQGPGAPAAFEANARARQLCGELNRPERLLPILSGLWLYHMVRNALDRAQQLVDEMRWRGELRDDVAMLYTACRASGMVCFFRGDFETARAELERALSLYEPRRRASLAVAISSVDPLVDVLSVLATTLTCCGFLDQARLRCEAAVAEARRLAHAHSLGFALFWACLVCRLPRLHSRARECADELFAVSEDHGFPFFRAAGLAYRGWCMAISDRIGDGIPLLTAGLPDLRARAAEAFVDVWVLPMLADAHLAAGQPLVALEYLSEAERSAEATQARASLAETFRLRGESMLVTGHCGTAENSFRDALALAERQGAKLFELRAATSLARLRRDQGQRAEARDLLVPVYAWFTEGFDAPDLVDAKTLIDQLG